MVSFSELPAVKKETIFGAARKTFDTSYFVMALAFIKYVCRKYHRTIFFRFMNKYEWMNICMQKGINTYLLIPNAHVQIIISYSRVRISSDTAFLKILKKPSIVQE